MLRILIWFLPLLRVRVFAEVFNDFVIVVGAFVDFNTSSAQLLKYLLLVTVTVLRLSVQQSTTAFIAMCLLWPDNSYRLQFLLSLRSLRRLFATLFCSYPASYSNACA